MLINSLIYVSKRPAYFFCSPLDKQERSFILTDDWWAHVRLFCSHSLPVLFREQNFAKIKSFKALLT